MEYQRFSEVVETTINRAKAVLTDKAKEYATEDRLHNFKVGAALMQCSPEQALFGFMTKHLVSLSDMCKSGKTYTDEMWDEKIGDAINYLLLLRAVVAETNGARAETE